MVSELLSCCFVEPGDDERDFVTAVYVLIFFLHQDTASVCGASYLLKCPGASSALIQSNIWLHVSLICQQYFVLSMASEASE